ncbi:MAG: type VI secretion system contractile sheath small subunit [Myxococcota bacterium]
MAKKDQTVAPKERVNITYKAKVGDVTEERELPMKILAIGDYTGQTDERQLEDRDPINIDKDNFKAVMAEQKLGTEVSVPNKLTGDGDLGVSLSFESLKDFEPAGIAKQIPELQDLLAMREALVAVRGPLGGFPKFRRAVEAILKDPDKVERLMAELRDESPAAAAPEPSAEAAPPPAADDGGGGDAPAGDGEPSDEDPQQG